MSTVTSDGPETRRDIYNKSAVNRRVGVWVVLGRLGKSIVAAAKGIEEEKRCSRAMIVTTRESKETKRQMRKPKKWQKDPPQTSLPFHATSIALY